ncbi:hypothetical protein NFI95_05805 [Acetobacteraceae bacterium KSS8]|uniref:Uncharacterized protein n=1 Tax=Endosaccharibacter trunci TaxID=2812733 RepID=A0ABT1W529_9PROT|nr:hypothetical protein [Acetobacteraceae bacterium KSS8]
MNAFDARGFRAEPGDTAWPIRRGELSDYERVAADYGPLYDCGGEECEQCERKFGPDRSEAIEREKRRAAAYARMGEVA